MVRLAVGLEPGRGVRRRRGVGVGGGKDEAGRVPRVGGVDAEVDTVGGVLVRARARGVAALVRGECQRVPVGFRVRVRFGVRRRIRGCRGGRGRRGGGGSRGSSCCALSTASQRRSMAGRSEGGHSRAARSTRATCGSAVGVGDVSARGSSDGPFLRAITTTRRDARERGAARARARIDANAPRLRNSGDR